MSKKFKARWIYKALSWKIISALLGALVVFAITGQYAMSGGYLLLYVPISMFLFVAHEKFWHILKVRKRCPECDGTGMVLADGKPIICSTCEGSGDRCISSV